MVDQKLLDAIKQYLNQGVQKDSIKTALIKSGWSEKDVNKAFEKITGQKIIEEKKVAEEKKATAERKEAVKTPLDKRKIFFIAGGVIVVLLLALLVYFFLLRVGFSEDIPDDLVPLGKFNKFIGEKKEGYNSLALKSVSPLKDVIQDGKVNLVMTNKWGTKIIDAVGLTVENGQITSTALKVKDPSFDVKFTEKTFDNLMIVSDPKPTFLEGYKKGHIKIKAYGDENKGNLGRLDSFVQHFFTF